MTSLRRLLAALALLTVPLLTTGCDLLFPPSALDTALARCDLDAEPVTAWRSASLELIEAAERGELDLASDRWIVRTEADVPTPTPRDRVRPPGMPPAPTEAAADVRRAYGLDLARSLAPGLELVRMSAAPTATARALLADPRVLYVQPDVRLAPVALGDDALFGQQWNLTSFGVPEAWLAEAGASDVTVAVIDTGIDLDHVDLGDRLLSGWDFYDGDDDPSAGTAQHGTHVAGIVGAIGGNATGVAGVVPSGVAILPIKVFDDAGGDAYDDAGSALAAVIDALHWVAGEAVSGPAALARPVTIANLSLADPSRYTVDPALEDAIRVARRAGVLVFAAAGNAATGLQPGAGVNPPANGPCAIAVGSVDEDRTLSSFSNYDRDERTVDLVGPGGSSADPNPAGVLSTFPNDGYEELEGTSMSTPWVAGVAALLASQNPGWSDEDLLRAMLAGAWLPDGASRLQMGFGIPCPDALLGGTTVCGR